ncbi:MAG TPA: glycerol-3-phosphate acyltransferase, partial [Candidatus Hydrogenedentes bacterium]|nr:glycerol-3-phosphate acyltransferase [Candidatus Hydrogenedentota bacterium]
IAAVVFAAVFGATRMVSAGSMSAAAVLAAAAWFLEPSLPVRIAATLIAILVVWKHRANIRRIISGTENRL